MASQKSNTAKEEAKTNSGRTESHYTAIVNQCERIAQLNPPYIWGGGHSGFEYKPGGLDCSGAVSLVLHLAGYELTAPMTSGELASWGEPGRGQVTIWAGPDHVFLMFENKCWAWSCPGCKNGWQPLDNYGDPNHPTNSGPYVAHHPPGLSGPAGHVIPGNISIGGESGSYLGVSTTSKAAAISSFLEFPGLLESAESEALKGQRSLMNDKPLLPFVEELCQSSLRNFMSMPNGNFYAFIPDYFGGLTERQPYWEIKDIEILDGRMYLTDDALATHVYVVGDTNADQEITVIDKIQTAGVVTVFNAFMANFISGIDAPSITNPKANKKEQTAYQKQLKKTPSLADKQKAIAFLEKYGARPYYEEAPMIRSAYFEMFLAYQKFCLMWSQQFEAQFELTFMPELFPGGIVAFPDYGIQCYIQEVNHRGSYTEGFSTIAKLIAPAALPSGRRGVSAGMVRAKALTTSVVNAIQPQKQQKPT